MEPNEKLLLQNKAWSEEKVEQDKDFFSRLAHQQAPKFLWIGCSDSRVPANEITGTDPGEMFVHRNIANMVVHNDLNMLSVLQYAVDVLKVDHIIVCGHYGCGGVKAALTKSNFGLINKWLQNIKEVYHANKNEVDSISDPEERTNLMVERNVMTQCHELVKTSIIQKAWHQRNMPKIHGWVYGLNNGLLKELLTIEANPDNVPEAFRYNESEL
jgi:carbonic anhydrase